MPFKKTHGMSRDKNGRHTRLYGRWANIKDRCHNPKCKDYKKYGGRGINVCDEWRNNFKKFAEWAIENGYRDGLQLDRIDNNKGYSPENCRFVDGKTNSNNRRDNLRVSLFGKLRTISEVAMITGIPAATLYGRLYRGEEIEHYVERRKKGQYGQSWANRKSARRPVRELDRYRLYKIHD